MKKIAMVGAMAALVAVLAGCSGGSTGPVQTVELTTKTTAFEPKEITVKQGQPVKLVLNNQDVVLHDFSIKSIPAEVKESHGDAHGHAATADVHVAAEGGKTGTVEFTVTKEGTYEFTCTEPGHKESGMVGKLIVTK